MTLTNTTGHGDPSARSAHEDDAALAEAAKEDVGAFDVLYRRYATRIYRYCRSRSDDAQVAEDLMAQMGGGPDR